MDIRIEKTEKAIKSAFLELRAHKALEKITVKELCAKAYINKSTFYSHYADIYALSDALENEMVSSILHSISGQQEYTLENPEDFTRALCIAFMDHIPQITVLFSGKEQSCLADRIEAGVKEMIFRKYPEYRESAAKNILLSYCIQGAYHAFLGNRDADNAVLVQVIGDISKALKALYGSASFQG